MGISMEDQGGNRHRLILNSLYQNFKILGWRSRWC